jgi:hypothetical protein
MAEDKYDLVFNGQLMPGFELAQVKNNIQQLFRVDQAKVEMLFSGRDVPLKKGVDAEVAAKYRMAIEKAGARVTVVGVAELDLSAQAQVSTPLTDKIEPSKTIEPAQDRRAREIPLTTELGARPSDSSVKAVLPQEINAPYFQLAELGEAMLASEFQPVEVSVDVDISNFTVAPQDGNLVRSDELFKVEAAEINIPDIEIAPIGSDLLAASEKAVVPATNIDTSIYSLAPVGQIWQAPAKPVPAPPNVDHLKLIS